MENLKIGRNDLCPCGSGKKYKKCCLLRGVDNDKTYDTSYLDQQIRQTSELILEHDEDAIINSIESLKTLLSHPDLSSLQKRVVHLNLVRAYQRRGEHHAAIETLNSIEGEMRTRDDQIVGAYIKELGAISYCVLGFYKESCDLFNEILNELDQLDADPRMRATVALEAGKAFRSNGDNDRAQECWEQALKFFEGKDDEIEHYARAKANLGFILLHDPDETKQEEGVKVIEESSDLKRLIGDLEGLANNYCNLGLYYWRKKRYERAIAFIRKDLHLSRKVGDLRAIASTLGNLSTLYADLKQLSLARQLLREAKQIGETLKDKRLIEIANHNLEIINDIGKKAGLKREKIGPAADCGCGSGKAYQECCGQADFEPIDIPMLFGGISEDIEQIYKDIKDSGGEPSHLDFILRQTDESKRRLAWSQIKGRDGWLEMHELPDMANYYLSSAKALADESNSDSDSSTKPLACVSLSVCALEAFINQVAFFLHETQTFSGSKRHSIPPELSGDVMDFQRHTKLEDKWDILGKVLCGDCWPPPKSLWIEFQNIVYIRNELIHFKVADYEQVVPPPKKPYDIMRRVPESVKTRKIPHGWPARLLTPSFANWYVNVVESMIGYFRRSYGQSRLSGANNKAND